MASLEDPALCELLEGFKRLLQTGEFSDLTVYSTDRKYAVHSAVICPQSAFFWIACTPNFKEQIFQEIDLRNDDRDAVHCMIRYFYTLAYPEDVEINDPVLPTAAAAETICSILSGDPIEDDDSLVMGGDIFRESQKRLLETGSGQGMSSAEESRELALGLLHRDLLVYALAEKYGITDLKKKAARHFDKELQRIETTMEIIDIVRDVYSATPSHDRGLRDIVVTKVHGEIQHRVEEAQFMKTLAGKGEFCADLLSYTVKEGQKQYEAALATIEHPGYCNQCHATLIVKRSASRKRNVTIKKYCAKCEPWG